MSDTNMVFCRECGQSMHSTAPICPHCGAPQKPAMTAPEGDGIPRTFGSSISICFSKYARFSGRAPRAEYWWFVLFSALVGFVIGFMASILHSHALHILICIFDLGILLPQLSVAVRRLHDTNRSGWWIWLGLIPIVGTIILFIWYATPGTPGQNQFGAENGIIT